MTIQVKLLALVHTEILCQQLGVAKYWSSFVAHYISIESTHTEFWGVQEESLLHLEVPEAQDVQDTHLEDHGSALEVQKVPDVQVVQRDQGMDLEYYWNGILMILPRGLIVQHSVGSVLPLVQTDGQ